MSLDAGDRIIELLARRAEKCRGHRWCLQWNSCWSLAALFEGSPTSLQIQQLEVTSALPASDFELQLQYSVEQLRNRVRWTNRYFGYCRIIKSSTLGRSFIVMSVCVTLKNFLKLFHKIFQTLTNLGRMILQWSQDWFLIDGKCWFLTAKLGVRKTNVNLNMRNNSLSHG